MKKVSFHNVHNAFQEKLRNDIKSIRESPYAFIPADKTRNLYEMDKSAYDKLLMDNITKTYRKTDNNVYNEINREAKQIASGFNIADRVECLAKTNAFITLKDHKENFTSNPKCRLINPAKSEIGKVNKLFIEKIT